MSKLLKKLSRYDAIIVEDIGYVQQSRQKMEVLFTFQAERQPDDYQQFAVFQMAADF